MSLKQLPEATAKLITTSQVITSVSSVVKELFENSVDAGATNIEVILENNGLDRIEIRDDGRGIKAVDTKFMCLSGYTSKISSFEDISNLNSYGFRGEALASLCHIADVTITTRTAEDKYAMTYIIDQSGEIKSSKPSHHGIGTQVTVINLFKNLPVRRQYIRNSKTANLEAKKAEHIVKSLAIINPEIRVTFINNKMHLCSKPVEATLKKSAIQVLGYRIISKCEELTYNTDEVQLHMIVPNKNCSDLGELCQNSTDYIFIYFNKRAVTHKKIQKEITKSVSGYFADKFPARKHPTSIVSITVPPNVMDINLEPNKTKVLCKIEDVILNLVQKVLSDYYEIEAPISETNEDKAPLKRSKVDVQAAEEIVSKKSKVTSYNTSISLDTMVTPEISHMESKLNSHHGQEKLKSLDLPLHKNKSTLGQQSDSYNEFVNEITAINYSTPITGNEQTSPRNSFISHTENNLTEKYGHVNNVSLMKPSIEIQCDNFNISNEKTFQDYSSSLEEIASIRENVNLLLNKEDNINQTLANQQHAGNVTSINHPEFISESVKEINANACATDNFPVLLSEESEVFLDIDLNPTSIENIAKSNDQLEKNDNISSNSNSVNTDNITREAWSKGHVKNSKGELIQGPVVIMAGPPKNKKSEFQNLSYHSVSSQMGCKEQNGFTKFSRIRRPKILAENPGIAFTRVAGLLAEEWKNLSHSERLKYESDEKKCEVNISKQNSSPSLNNKNSNNSSVVDLLRSPDRRKAQKGDIHQSCGTINCSIDEIKEEMNYFTDYKRVHCTNGNISLIGQLRPSGVWLYKKGSEIGVLKHWALQETVLFHRMMSEHSVPLIALEEKIRVKPKALGEELWQILSSLQQSFDPFINKIAISSPCITKNGFKIEIIEGPTDNSVFITHVASVCRYYGVNELWDLLNILKEKGLDCTLYQSRPIKIISYFKSESVRKCRESPVLMDLHQCCNPANVLTQYHKNN